MYLMSFCCSHVPIVRHRRQRRPGHQRDGLHRQSDDDGGRVSRMGRHRIETGEPA